VYDSDSIDIPGKFFRKPYRITHDLEGPSCHCWPTPLRGRLVIDVAARPE
jgi:hypothetical protein